MIFRAKLILLVKPKSETKNNALDGRALAIVTMQFGDHKLQVAAAQL